MRKIVKTKLLSCLNTLQHANQVLVTMIPGAHYGESIELLTQMQEMIIEAGNWIENFYDSDHYYIKKLEQICEAIYEISQCLEKIHDVMLRVEELSVLVESIYSDIEKEKVHIEVLFIPYNVSMWDSLESVWLATKNDEQVDSYVMPIPYYDVLPDGNLGNAHYEGDKYPSYVPIEYYEDYSLEKRQPDIVFFHNPYDGKNAVTRVDEKYYAAYIRKYTQLLVYVPYMVSNIGPARHQCVMPGVLYSDRVITQGGSVYKLYCECYTKAIKEAKLEDYFIGAKEKFLPYGSPKIDKLLNMIQKGNIKVPTEWEKKIYKKNNTKKRIILYNLSLGTLLENDSDYLKKIKYVLTVFENNQEDILLIVRPHPLMINTLNSMRPGLKDEYCEMMEEYKYKGWGIYDDTPDPNLSMAIADAYYGDDSSMLTMFGVTGRPTMLQNMARYDHTEKEYTLSFKAYFGKKRILFSADEMNGLFVYDISTGQSILVDKFPNELDNGTELYACVKQYGEELFFFPDRASEIAVVNINTYDIYKIPIQGIDIGNKVRYYPLFYNYHITDESVTFQSDVFECDVKFVFHTKELIVNRLNESKTTLKNTKPEEQHSITVTAQYMKDIIWPITHHNLAKNVWLETDYFCLEGFIKYIVKRQSERAGIMYENAGEKIYKEIIRTKLEE